VIESLFEKNRIVSETVSTDERGFLMSLPLAGRTLLGRLIRPFSPGYGTCFRCQLPWNVAAPHSTQYNEDSACFPLCEACWSELSEPSDRLPFYRRLWEDEWHRESAADWANIERAVLEGR
jgi:hypothetical protein